MFVFLCNIFESFCFFQAFAFHPVFEDEPLTPGKVFPSILLADILSMPIQLFPVLANFIVNARTSTHKIVEFLGTVEVDNKRHHLQQVLVLLVSELVSKRSTGTSGAWDLSQ